MAPFPPAPALSPQALQVVFVYPDTTRNPDPSNRFSDAPRLEFLGRKFADVVYTEVISTRWSHSSAVQLQASSFPGMIDQGFRAFIERAVRAYQWQNRVQGPFPPGVNPQSAAEAERVFLTYVGAVSVQYPPDDGYNRLRDWFTDLLLARG
ncbi:hypothetical protein C8Q77DRAFT_1210783 [Trametes polyzona]|nr:hypothetical protein C8Q77DRAFT_1210783 [Trametes polyzona]